MLNRFVYLFAAMSTFGPLASAQVSSDYTLPVVTVTASQLNGMLSVAPTSNYNYMTSTRVSAPMAMAAFMRASPTLQDVRCTAISPQGRRTTSHEDTLGRFLAANEVFATLETSKTIWNLLLSAPVPYQTTVNGVRYKGYRVTYADGGTEIWIVNPAPASSMKLMMDPVSGSLKMGDGVVKSASCGRG